MSTPDPIQHVRSWRVAAGAWKAWYDAASPAETEAPGPASGEALLLAERAERLVFARRRDIPSSDWDRGYLFTPQWQVSWRRLGAQVRIVAAGEAPGAGILGTPASTLDLSEARAERRYIALWGHRAPNERTWIELFVPHFMDPPDMHPDVDDDHGAKDVRRLLEVVSYADATDGRPLFARYAGLAFAATSANDLTPLST